MILKRSHGAPRADRSGGDAGEARNRSDLPARSMEGCVDEEAWPITEERMTQAFIAGPRET